MIRLITGFPGASKTLNTVKELIEDDGNKGRQIYYYNIRALMVDLDFSYSFAGWFYGTYLQQATEKDLERVLPIVRAVHKNSAIVTEDDLPFLVCHWRQVPIYQTWLDWVFKLYPASRTLELRRFLDACEHFDFKPTKNRLKRFRLHWEKMKHPHEWHSLPYGSVIAIDEAQEFFPPRSAGSKVPPHIAKMNVHRHSGFDLHLITQHPRLLDTQIRSVTGRHVHFHNPDNGEKVVRYQSAKLMDVERDSDLKDCLNLSYLPRDSNFYGSYYSAEVHTHTRIRPDFYKKIIPSLLAIIVCFGACGYVFWQLGFKDKFTDPEPVTESVDNNQIQQFNDKLGYSDDEQANQTNPSRCIVIAGNTVCR